MFDVDVLDVTLVGADGSRTEVSSGDLMVGFRDSSARPSLSQVFWPDAGRRADGRDPVVRQWFADRAEELLPGTRAVEMVVRRCDAGIDILTADRTSETSCEVERMQL